MSTILSFGQRQQAMNGLPFYGRSDFNFAASKSPYTNGISIKILPLSDLSRAEPNDVDEFESQLIELNNEFRIGSRISGIKINSTFTNKKRNPTIIYGKFKGFKIDRKTKTIRAFIQDPKTLKVIEVYPSSLNRLNESRSYKAKTFVDFLI